MHAVDVGDGKSCTATQYPSLGHTSTFPVMGQCGWRREWGLDVAAPSLLPTSSSHAKTHRPPWQCGAAAAMRDPGKSDNRGVGKQNRTEQSRNEKSPLPCAGYFQGVALLFSQATADCRATWVGR